MSEKPKTREIPVEDIEIRLTSGLSLERTLRPGDTQEVADNAIFIVIANPPEEITIYKHAIAYVASRKRIHREREPAAS